MQNFSTTKEALEFLKEMKSSYPNGIMLYLSGGCCDGSSMLCYELGDFKLGSNDILLATIDDVSIYTHRSHYSYLGQSDLILDIKEGNGNEFSLEYGCGRHFILDSKICPTKI